MPVAHLGLSVPDISVSSPFYVTALQPLGYRLLYTCDDHYGFGIDEADFFLTELRSPSKPAPVHIAFYSPDKAAVRDFYANALNAGGGPSGAPGYRRHDEVFNAAVTDLDGNTVEVVFNPRKILPSDNPAPASSASSAHRLASRIAPSHPDRHSYIPTSRPESSYAASSAAPPPRSSKPSSVTSRADPVPYETRSGRSRSSWKSSARSVSCSPAMQSPSRALVGTLVGAAAGAAAIYSMISSDHDTRRKDKSARPGLFSKNYSRSDRDDARSLKRSYTHYDRREEYRPTSSRHVTRSKTQDDDLYQLPKIGTSHRSYSPRRDSLLSSSSRRSGKSRPMRENHDTLVFRDAFRPDRFIEYHSSPRSARSGYDTDRRASAPGGQTSNRSQEANRRHSEYPSRTPPTELPPPRTTVEPRALNPPRKESRSPPPSRQDVRPRDVVPLEVIRSNFDRDERDGESSSRAKYADTVLPEDSISCVGWRPRPSGRAESSREYRPRRDDGDYRRKERRGSRSLD